MFLNPLGGRLVFDRDTAELLARSWWVGVVSGLIAIVFGILILTMLADTMMPEAFEHGGKLVGLVTTLGFALAFALTMLD